jgi:MOSC domain-containing protein YiiM/SAM-dependent methyltransferase
MSDTVHPLAVRGFGHAADAYERGRPGYPPDAVASIAGWLELGPGRTVLDLAAGTGKMTRLLVPSGARVIAVEPVAGMRAKLATSAPGALILEGTAEAIPLPNASVDGVVVAQAFHWFDAGRALSEFHRVLRPGGRLVLAYNVRDESVPWVRRMGELIERTTGGEAPSQHRGWRERAALSGLFDPLETVELRHVHRLTVEGVVDRVASISTVAALEPSAQAELIADLRALLAGDPVTAGRDEIDLPYTTRLFRTTRRSPVAGTVGIVVSVNRNDGGVPKLPVAGARIHRLGLEGDRHREPEPVHGGVDGAICLYAQEAIERVRADGHASFPGAYGENLTLLGIDWAALAPGDRLALGEGDIGPLLEITKPTVPCQAQAHWFREARIARISHKVHPEDTRWYARVLREGDVGPGTPVRVVARG